MVGKMVRILKELDMEPISPGQTREILKFKGKEGKSY